MCLFPQKVIMYDVIDDDTNEVKKRLHFVAQDKIEKVFEQCVFLNKQLIEVPCNKCIECFEAKANEWSVRIEKEAEKYKNNCFLTLTYAETDGSLKKRDFQLFLKRLRKFVSPLKIRYFGCGEYGSKGMRPHYHLIIFNWLPDDLKFFKYDRSGYPIYLSKTIEKLWSFGFHSVMHLVGFNTKYCAKYLQKLNDIPEEYEKPFVSMSTHPGLGYDFFQENYESILNTDKIYSHGSYIRMPRYFEKLVLRMNDKYVMDDYLLLKSLREKKFNLSKTYIDVENKRLKWSLKFDKLKI